MTGGTMGSVRLFDAEDAALLATREGHGDQIHAVAAARDADLYASADDTGVVALWRGRELEPIRSWNAGGGRVDGLLFSIDAAVLLIGCADGVVRRVPLDASAPPLEPIRAHRKKLHAMSMDAKGRVLVSSGADGRIAWRSLDADTGGGEIEVEAGEVLHTAVSPDGAWIAACGESGTLRLFERLGGGDPITLQVAEGKLFALAWHPTKPLLAWGGEKGGAGVVELGPNARPDTVEVK